MGRVPFDVDRTMTQALAPSFRTDDAGGIEVQCDVPLHFEQVVAACDQSAGGSCRRVSGAEGLSCFVSLGSLRLHGPSHSGMGGHETVLPTHTPRHSPRGLRWRNNWGETFCLQPGATVVNRTRLASLAELSPATPATHCECVRIVLRTEFTDKSAVRFEAAEFPFCNSTKACVRLILGRYFERVAPASPLPGVSLFDIDIAPFSAIELPVARNHTALAVLTYGSLESGGAPLEPWHVLAFDGREPPARLATKTGAAVLWFAFPHRPTSNGGDQLHRDGP